MAKIEIERVAERGAGLSGGREIAKNKKTSGGPSRGAKPKIRGAMAPLGPPAATPLAIRILKCPDIFMYTTRYQLTTLVI